MLLRNYPKILFLITQFLFDKYDKILNYGVCSMMIALYY